MAATGASFYEFAERGATHTGRLLATNDKEIGKTGPVPSASTPSQDVTGTPARCGANRAILCSRPREWGRHKAILLLLSAAREQLDAAFLEGGCAQRPLPREAIEENCFSLRTR